jgi:sugar-specific transcriptional regulator TrmB
MTSIVELALPCRLISLKVRLGPERGVTTLEDLVAKAVLAGRTSVEGQADLFGLPRRLLLDVMHSLWSKGYVIIDLESGAIELSDIARDTLVRGDTLNDAAAEIQDRQFLFEPITGRILTIRSGVSRPPDATVQVPLSHGIEESDLPQDELVRAVQTAIAGDRRQGFRKSVLEVGFGNPVLRPPALLRWLVVPVSAAVEPDTGRLVVTMADTAKWNGRDRTRVREHLARLADAEPRHPFVQQLRGRADVPVEAPESAAALFTRFSSLVDRLEDLPPTQIANHHHDLVELSARLEDGLAALDRARTSVTVVSHAEGHRWAVNSLIEAARTQLVIVTPAIGYRALNPLLPALRHALDRGVQLVVLWGRTLADSLQGRVGTAFEELAARYHSLVLIPDRSARTEACVVIQDDTRALIGSHSLLEAEPLRDNGAISVLVEPAGDQSGPPEVLTDLLFWARGAYPYWQDSQRISIYCTEQAGPLATAGDGETPATPATVAADPDEAAVKLWAAGWAEYRAALADASRDGEAIGPAVGLVTDGEHQHHVWSAVRSARQRLVLADDKSDSALLGKLLSALRERAEPRPAVDLVCPSPTAAKAFAEHPLSQREDARLHQQRAAARLLIADDEALIGSFSPLGDDGTRQVGGSRRSQLGVRIQSGLLVAELSRSLPIAPPEPITPDRPALPRTRSAVTAALPLLVEARLERSRGGFGAVVAARLAELDQPGAVLDVWRDKGVPAGELRPAAAALIRQQAQALRDAPADHPELLRWVNWLLSDAWQQSRFVAAAVISGLAPAAALVPSAASCLVAAPIEHGPLGGLLTEPALELSDSGPDAAAAGAAGALAEMMLWGSADGREAVRLLAHALPPSWRDFGAAALEYEDRTKGAAVPIDAIAAELSRLEATQQGEAQWAELAERIDKLERLRQRFNFGSGVAMHNGLFEPAGVLTLIRTAARTPAERNVPAGRLPRDVRQLLDDLVEAAKEPPIQWHKQQHFLRDITSIVRTARALVAAAPPTGAAAAALSSAACRDLAVAAAKGQDELLADANGIPPPYGLPLRALLERITPLTRWGLS